MSDMEFFIVTFIITFAVVLLGAAYFLWRNFLWQNLKLYLLARTIENYIIFALSFLFFACGFYIYYNDYLEWQSLVDIGGMIFNGIIALLILFAYIFCIFTGNIKYTDEDRLKELEEQNKRLGIKQQ